MQKYYTYLISVLFLMVCGTTVVCGDSSDEKIVTQKITVAYENTVDTVKMKIINGMGYVRINDVAEFYNANLVWQQISKKVTLDFGSGKTVTLFEDSEKGVFGEVERTFSKTTRMIKHTLYIPLEMLLSAPFADISNRVTEWNSTEKLLRITPAPEPKPLAPIPTTTAPSTVLPTTTDVQQLGVIVLDAGHGGEDPGAKMKDGSQEKDFNLIVTQKTAEILRDEYNKKVLLTRDTDVFIPLYDRAEIANKNRANLFVSIHSNACGKRDQRGFEIYFLSEYASDKEAERVAQQENAALEYEHNGKGDVLNTILWSMAINEYMNESSELCYFVEQGVAEHIGCPDRGVKQAGFAVLRGAKMPAALVEMGYMTNPTDLDLLKDERFQDKMARAIAQGIVRFQDRVSKR